MFLSLLAEADPLCGPLQAKSSWLLHDETPGDRARKSFRATSFRQTPRFGLFTGKSQGTTPSNEIREEGEDNDS